MHPVADADSFSDIRTSILGCLSPTEDPLLSRNPSGLWGQTTRAAEAPSLVGWAITRFSAFQVWYRVLFLWRKQTNTVLKGHNIVTFVTFDLWWDYVASSNKAVASKSWDLSVGAKREEEGHPPLEVQADWWEGRSSKSLLQERETPADHTPRTVPSHLSLKQLLPKFGPEGWGSASNKDPVDPHWRGEGWKEEGSPQHRYILTILAQQMWQHCTPKPLVSV